MKLWSNGTQLSNEQIGGTTGGVTVNTQLTNGRIGTRYTSATYANGSLSELMYYTGELTTADRQRVERYLGAKYSITVP